MRKPLFLLLLTGLATQATAQSLYDLNTIQEIKIYFGFSNWDYRMDTAKAGAESYIPADSVVINGTALPNCGVKFKGNSSYSANRTKNPLHIKLDEYQNQDYQGYEDLKLGNGFTDNSMIREPLAYAILRQYMDAPLSNFAKVYINGNYYGIMTNAEDINDEFLIKHYYSTKHTFVKCNPQNVGPGGGSNGSNLEYSGTTLSNYSSRYELKSDTGWSELFQLCDTLNNYFQSFNSMADVDRFLWMLAFNNVTVNLDSYSGSFRQNYYLYRNHARQWIPTVWDLNMCFGGFSMAGGTTSNLNATTMQTMNYLLHKNEAAWPLIYKLLNNPFYEKMYVAHMRTINNENFKNASYKTQAASMQALISNAVQTDGNFLSTYTNFQNALTTNTTGGGGGQNTSPGIYPLMDSRATYLNNALSATPPTISNVVSNTATPAFAASFTIRVTVTNDTAVYLGYRFNKAERFVRVRMYDDGAHDDGSANDDVYGAAVTMDGALMQYYVYAENATAGMFSPERAEHEFYTVQAGLSNASTSDLVINELTANNNTGIQNEKGKYKDWIELLNTTTQTLSLSGLYLSDSIDNLTKWAFPAEAFILPGQHLVLWADDEDQTYVDLHTNFNLSNTGDALILSDGTTIFDSLSYGNQAPDAAIARCADGTGNFVAVTDRTPSAVNSCSSSIYEVQEMAVTLVPNPTAAKLSVQSEEEILNIDILSLHGERLLSTNDKTIDLSSLPAGCYLVLAHAPEHKTWRGKVIKY
ncbi:MAG: CotH kinase family protein [Bacteroidetes bacterium]|nr:CotH kinase family protein [Bacteroidota bacterium]